MHNKKNEGCSFWERMMLFTSLHLKSHNPNKTIQTTK